MQIFVSLAGGDQNRGKRTVSDRLIYNTTHIFLMDDQSITAASERTQHE